MLTGITLENFKAFKEPQFIPIKPITLVFGPNSAGKSSIMHALAFMQHVFENHGECDPLTQNVGWETFDLGGFNNLIFNHDTSADSMIRIGLHFKDCSARWGFKPTEAGPLLSYFSSHVDASTPTSHQISLELDNRKISLSENHPRIRTASIQIWQFFCTGRSWESLSAANVEPIISQDAFFKFTKEYLSKKSANFHPKGFIPTYGVRRSTQNEDIVISQSSPFQDSKIRHLRHNLYKELSSNPSRTDLLNEFFSALDWNYLLTDDTLSLLASKCEHLFSNRAHLGSTRNPPERRIEVTLPIHEPWRMVLNNEHLRKSINESLAKLDMPYKLEVSHIEEIHYKAGCDPVLAQQFGETSSIIERIQRTKAISFVTSNGVSLSHKDLGHGVSTTLPMLVAVHASNGKLVSVEQPELHIHPRIQTVLGDLFIQSSLAGWGCDPDDYITDYYPDNDSDYYSDNQIFYDPDENNHLFIETHSEHLILRILRRIRETTERDFEDWPDSLKQACPNGIKPEHVAVLYVEPGEQGAKVIELPVTLDGDFEKPWPSGFFTERDRELF